MAFRISEFKANMDRYGGPAQTSLFEVQIVPKIQVRSGLIPRELTMFCKTATVPGLNLNTAQYDSVAQLPKTFPQGIENSPMNAIFMLDSDHQVVSYFHSWMQFIVNYGTKGGNFAEVDGQLPYEVGYKDEYACRMIIKYYSTRGRLDTYYETVLDNVFPVSIGDIDLSWENNDSYGTLPVSFAYDRISFSGERIGFPGFRFSRGNGLVDLINSIGTIGQTIEQGFRPTGIQDAINRFTRVQDSFNTIGNIFR